MSGPPSLEWALLLATGLGPLALVELVRTSRAKMLYLANLLGAGVAYHSAGGVTLERYAQHASSKAAREQGVGTCSH